MKILFVATNQLRSMMLPMPIGLASIAAQLDDSHHELEVLDLMFSEQPDADLAATLLGFAPDLVAFSVRNLDNQSYLRLEYYLPGAKELVALCRKHSEAIVVVGGAAFTVAPAAVFEYLDPDFGIAGEGEISFPRLVAQIEAGIDCSDLPGLVWRENGRVEQNPVRPIGDLDSLAAPRRDLFDSHRYVAEGGFGSVVTKLGCSFRCSYCEVPHTAGDRWRTKSPERVTDEMLQIRRHARAPKVMFCDAIFNHPMEHAKQVCRAIIRRDLDVPWAASVHPAFLDRELVALMRDSGCIAASLSCDSGSEQMLRSLRKGFSAEQLRASAELLEELELRYALWLLIGGPGENRRTVEESHEFLIRREPIMVNMLVGIRLMPHTALAATAAEQGLISADDPLMEPRFYLSPGVEGWIGEYLTRVCSEHPNWTCSLSSSH
jgi:radical SAM superfamily enzyme YgiQ (UPF0313 family)